VDDPGFESRQGRDVSVSSNISRSPLEPIQPPIQWLPGLFPGDHSPLNNADIEPGWSNISTPLYASDGACREYCTYQHILQVHAVHAFPSSSVYFTCGT